MATKLELQHNEVVLLTAEGVAHGGRTAGYTDELILTNLNLVVVKKGAFGKIKATQAFPLNQIKIYNGQAQAVTSKDATGFESLDVYLLDRQERFRFSPATRATRGQARQWAAQINQVITGQVAPVEESPGRTIPGTEFVADALKGTIGVFKSKLAPASKTPAQPATPLQVAAKCKGCGAPVSGLGGRLITCEYCGSTQQI